MSSVTDVILNVLENFCLKIFLKDIKGDSFTVFAIFKRIHAFVSLE